MRRWWGATASSASCWTWCSLPIVDACRLLDNESWRPLEALFRGGAAAPTDQLQLFEAVVELVFELAARRPAGRSDTAPSRTVKSLLVADPSVRLASMGTVPHAALPVQPVLAPVRRRS